jgi:hypothetical protein
MVKKLSERAAFFVLLEEILHRLKDFEDLWMTHFNL